jgi:hypothetical protein
MVLLQSLWVSLKQFSAALCENALIAAGKDGELYVAEAAA